MIECMLVVWPYHSDVEHGYVDGPFDSVDAAHEAARELEKSNESVNWMVLPHMPAK